MQLSDAQSDKVRQWIDSGLSLAEIQVRLDKEDGLRLSYMDVKFLVDDLKLLPKDPVEPPKAVPPGAAAAAAAGGRPPGSGQHPAGAGGQGQAGGEDFGTGEPLSPDSPYEDPLSAAYGAGGGQPQAAHEPAFPGDPGAEFAGGPSEVQVHIDQITRPGAMVSGHVVFSDAVRAEWYLDQMGRFGLIPPSPGYRPSNADLQAFQLLLDRELQKIGY